MQVMFSIIFIPTLQCIPLKAKVQRILAWKWRDPPFTEVKDDRPGHEGEIKKLWGFKEREFLLKYHGFSYWDVEWVTETQMEIFATHQVQMIIKLLAFSSIKLAFWRNW